MKLIADSGGTKTQWCGVTSSSRSGIITTIGLNPNFVPDSTITGVVSDQVLPELKGNNVTEVWFYGAGCANEATGMRVRNAIEAALPGAAINVSSDLTGAARGLLGRGNGFVCMIGTGSNSGYYDGESITKNVPPLGFILGDEGSGAFMGKRLLADFLREIMPSGLAEEFRQRYGAEKDDVVSHVYSGIFPSRFIAGFVEFINQYLQNGYCRDLVTSSFEEFVERNLKLYGTGGTTEIAVSGSVAWYFREILEEVFRKNGYVVSVLARDPIEGLIRFHQTSI
jgi:glucosamine kinase